MTSLKRLWGAPITAVVCILIACPGPSKSQNDGGSSCTAGEAACACRDDGSCTQPGGNQGAVCSTSNTCEVCTLGSPGCPPAHPICYSPCSSDLVHEDGTIAQCSVDGLLEGCLKGTTCVSGSCVASGAQPRACKTNLECPDFQACTGGNCYSNCETSADCGSGNGCYRRVCQPRCVTTASSCKLGRSCVSVDGDNGFCLDVGGTNKATEPARRTAGDFEVGTREVRFTNVKLSSTITITNNATQSMQFTVKKLEHTEYPSGVASKVTTNALAWVTMGQGTDAPKQAQTLTFGVDGNGGAVTLTLANAANSTLPRWEGVIEISNPQLGARRVDLTYLERPEGQWHGTMTYFANFPDSGLDAWAHDRGNSALLNNVGNAFIQRWATFRKGDLSVDELFAVISSTQLGSWKWGSVRALCAGGDNTACYPYSNAQGYSLYSNSITQYPIPTGATDFPLAMNLKADPADAAKSLIGKIVTAESLHFPGDPAVSLAFDSDPTTCVAKANGVLCGVSSFASTVLVGGRYTTTAADTACAKAPKDAQNMRTFTLNRTPWLVPGFGFGTDVDAKTGLRYRYECRDDLLPKAANGVALNNSSAAGNPIPDARTRVRKVELIDGALINGEDLIILFKESFPSFLGSTDSGFSSYGIIKMKRQVADLDVSSYTAGSSADARTPPTNVLGVSCSADVLKKATGSTTMPTATDAVNALADTLVSGMRQATGAPTPIGPADPAKVHFLCEDTGLFNGGSQDDGTANAQKVSCPSGSRVTFFTLGSVAKPAPTVAALAAQPCQTAFRAGPNNTVAARGTCQATLNGWVTNGTYDIVLNPVWRCTNTSQAYCSLNRGDLRADKLFFAAAETKAAFLPLRTEVENAFRYKTRFRNRQGTTVGFAPQICPANSDAVPYCYDPTSIEGAQQRVDCAVSLYTTQFATLTVSTRASLRAYLLGNFSYESEIDPTLPLPVIHDGYERLNAELLIMMGDESYTRAFSSRFDLAGSALVSFEGSLFEPNGINLSGGAGYEMYSLYQSTQYYQQALDRFYALSPRLWASIDMMGTTDGFITKETVVSYFDRLIRASAQKTRAWSEVARRYQTFNRPDLARLVVARNYTSAYLESIVLSRMMLKLGGIVQPEDRPQIVERVENAQLVYSSALLAMRESYQQISDEPTLFGFQPDYVPFPALDEGDGNAFDKTLKSAKSLLTVAAQKEDLALNSNRAFETDSAAFQSELVSVRNNYENQLASICGTFAGTDGRVYPAIPKYAYLNERAKVIGDPCGLAGNGQINDALLEVDKVVADFQMLKVRQQNLESEIAIEKKRLSDQCDLVMEQADYEYDVGIKKVGLNAGILAAEKSMEFANRVADRVANMAQIKKCIAIVGTAGGTDCPGALLGVAEYASAITTATITTGIAVVAIGSLKATLGTIEVETGKWKTERACDYATVESNAKTMTLALGFRTLELDAYSTELDMAQRLAAVTALRNEATRTMAEQSESEQLAINVEVARNDPNVRIYKNDAILTADRTFRAAVAEAYRATKVFEYYTSQSYAHLNDLFLVRLASRGDISLEAYLARLERDFRDFEETYGNPDERVLVISLRDDVLKVPRYDSKNVPLTATQRLELFRTALTNPKNLDERGYITLPFATGVDALSPLTRNHKVLKIQAEIIGSDVGDAIGRVYLAQKGTGSVRNVSSGEKGYYTFPTRVAVINPYFNGERVLSESVYTNSRLRDRPLVNTQWELVLNQKDEQANKDIDLASLSDIRLFMTYTDFTSL